MNTPNIIGFHIYRNRALQNNGIEQAIDIIHTTLHDCGVARNTYEPCVAMFIDGPRNTHINVTPQEMRDMGARVVFHAAYCNNPWANISDVRRGVLMDHITHLCELCAMNEHGSDIVIHSTTRMFDESINAPIMRELARIAQINVRGHIFVETMANNAQYASPRALNDAFAFAIGDTNTSNRLGICVDTAHIWGSGATISTREDCRAWFSELRTDIPYALHLNDSEMARGSHRDIHANIGMGQIWEGVNDGYVSAIEWARMRRAPIILERKDVNLSSQNIDARADIVHDLRVIASSM
jgi:deoxyribonuclease-4